MIILSQNSPSSAPEEPSKTDLSSDSAPQPTRQNDTLRLVGAGVTVQNLNCHASHRGLVVQKNQAAISTTKDD